MEKDSFISRNGFPDGASKDIETQEEKRTTCPPQNLKLNILLEHMFYRCPNGNALIFCYVKKPILKNNVLQ